ncbi:hypothetical protein [Sulfurimonas sp.]
MKVYRKRYGLKRVAVHIHHVRVGRTLRNVELNAAFAWNTDFKGVDYVCD